jgi:hypothetical protein
MVYVNLLAEFPLIVTNPLGAKRFLWPSVFR